MKNVIATMILWIFSSIMFLLCILLLSRITSSSKTLIGNIFFNYVSNEVTTGKLTTTILDPLPQFFDSPRYFLQSLNK